MTSNPPPRGGDPVGQPPAPSDGTHSDGPPGRFSGHHDSAAAPGILPPEPGTPEPGAASAAGVPPPATEAVKDRLALKGRSLREHAARGTIINGAYLVGLTSLGFLRGYIIAAFLSAKDYGIWGILIVGIGGLYWLKSIGISDKFVQQDEGDQELAFQKAFTLEAMITTVFGVFLAVAIPLVALAYGQPRIIAPAYVLLLALPATVLQTPIWVHFRSMDFIRQRRLQAYDPIVSFIVTIALAVAGLGYWALLIGAMAGQWSSALAAVRACPYKLAFRYDSGTFREYVGFSWPVLSSNISGFLVVQGSILTVSRSLGLGVTGYVALASTISQYTDRVDRILAETLYPAICAVKDRLDLLFETFAKSNRLALMWGVPFGAGAALFAPDLVHYVLGPRWHGAVGLIIAFSLIAAADQIAYNWDDYFRARGTTRPLAWQGALSLIVTFGLLIPLTLSVGVDGYIASLAIGTVVTIGARTYFLSRLFPALAMLGHVVKAITPTVPAVAAVLLVRLAIGGRGNEIAAIAELALYVTTVLGATAITQRALLREIGRYLRPGRTAGAPAAT